MLLQPDKNVTENVTDQQLKGDLISPHEKEQMALAKQTLYPLLLAFGTFGNVMTIAIHKHTISTSPLSVYFIVLAVADLVVLYSSCFVAWVIYVFDFNISAQSNVLCKIYYFTLYVSGCLSAWTLVAMTAQRAVCVLWPHRANVLCTVGKSKAIVASMGLFIAVIHTHLLYGYNLETEESRIKCTTRKEYIPFFREIWSIVDMLIFSLLPWLCLAVCNSLLVWKLKVSLRDAEVSLGSGQADRITDRKKKTTSITVTLIAVSAAFLILTFPIAFMMMLNFVNAMTGSREVVLSQITSFYVLQVSYPLWYANSCINFYVYCLTGSKFKKEAKQILSCTCKEDIDKPKGNKTVCRLTMKHDPVN